MKMMAMGVAALLASTIPVAAQEPDQDALCFVSVNSFLGQISKRNDPPPQAMFDQTHMAIGFYTGRMTGRFAGTELAGRISAAKTATFAMSLDEQKALLTKCIATFQADVRAIVEASKAK